MNITEYPGPVAGRGPRRGRSRAAWWVVLMAALLATSASTAAAVLISESITVGAGIPDDSSAGLESVHLVTTGPSVITGVTVTLTIEPSAGQSAFLGDLYAYIRHGDAISILLNRPGRRADETAGYDDDQSLSVTLSDAGPDIHSYRLSDSTPLTGALTGTFSPDGRATDPDSVLVTDSRTRLLDSFVGADPNGAWTLFVADLSGGGAHDLVSWGFDITAVAVPEPQVWAVSVGLLVWAGWRLGRAARFRGDTAP